MFFKTNFFLNKFIFFLNIKLIYLNFFFLKFRTKFNFFFYNNFNIQLSKLNNIYLILTFLTIFVCLNILNDLKKKPKYKFLFYTIIIPIYFMINTNNIFIFFFFYEVLLLISTVMVYYFSPNKRSKIISFYFLCWTQFGSFLFLISIILIYLQTNSCNFFFLKNFKFNFIIQLLFFIGVGLKAPIWPFSFWITKTHVEVNTSFSIFLSAILVKIAIISFNKFYFLLNFDNNFFFNFIIFIGIIDSSIKILNQTDFKKTIAYLTIQEMNILLFFLLNKNFTNFDILNFIFQTHIFLTFILFFLNHCIYIRYQSRNLSKMFGLSNISPKLSIILFIIVFIIIGFPLTIKFFIEIFFFKKIFLLNNFIFFFIIISVQFLTGFFFFKNLTTIVFGNSNKKIFEISKDEFLSFLLFFSFLLLIFF